MNPKEEAKRIANSRELTSIIFVYDDDPASEAIDLVVVRQDVPAEVNTKTMKIDSYDDLDEFSTNLIRGWIDL